MFCRVYDDVSELWKFYMEHGKREGRGRTNRSRVNAGNDRTVFPACIDACEITRIR